MSAVVVHHLEQSRSMRILWLLEELGVEYELKPIARGIVDKIEARYTGPEISPAITKPASPKSATRSTPPGFNPRVRAGARSA